MSSTLFLNLSFLKKSQIRSCSMFGRAVLGGQKKHGFLYVIIRQQLFLKQIQVQLCQCMFQSQLVQFFFKVYISYSQIISKKTQKTLFDLVCTVGEKDDKNQHKRCIVYILSTICYRGILVISFFSFMIPSAGHRANTFLFLGLLFLKSMCCVFLERLLIQNEMVPIRASHMISQKQKSVVLWEFYSC